MLLGTDWYPTARGALATKYVSASELCDEDAFSRAYSEPVAHQGVRLSHAVQTGGNAGAIAASCRPEPRVQVYSKL